MRDGGRRHPEPLVDFDLAPRPINASRAKRGERDGQHHPILEHYISREREKIEADVLREDRIRLAVWHLEDEPQEDVPVAHFDDGNQSGAGDGNGPDYEPETRVRERP